jgi:hypothetical protein
MALVIGRSPGYKEAMTLPPTRAEISARALRESLLAAPQPRTPSNPVPAPQEAVDPSLLPTAPELLAASPNLQRLCEGYHRTYRQLVARSRRQRLGIALLVAGVGVGSVIAARSGTLSPALVSELVLSVAVASSIALGILGVLWIRDDRRLRSAQGERLMRALQFNCGLPPARLEAFRRLCHPTTAFFDCYAVWRSQHIRSATGLAAVLASVARSGKRAAV